MQASHRRFARTLLVAVVALGLLSPVTLPGALPAAEAASVSGDFYAVAPKRIADSATGLNTTKATLGPGASRTIVVAGRGGVPSTGAVAAVLSVTVSSPTTSTKVTVFPSGVSRPATPNLTLVKGRTTVISMTARLGSGKVVVHNSAGNVNVAVDVQGWYTAGSETATRGSRLVPLKPARVADTRTGLGSAKTPIAKGGTRAFVVNGKGGVPTSGVKAVVVSVTSYNPTAATPITLYKSGSTRPNTPNLLALPSQSTTGLATVVPGSGKVTVHTATAATHVSLDVQGYYAATAAGPLYVPLKRPAKLADTRTGLGTTKAALGAGATRKVVVKGVAGVPADVSAVALSLTGTGATTKTSLTVWPTGTTRPATPNVFLYPGRSTSVAVVGKPGTGGAVSIRNASGSTHVVLDVQGSWKPPAGPPPPPADTQPPPPDVPALPTSVVDAAKALLEGTSPRQTGVATGAIDFARVSVVQGRVTDKGGAALGGVTISALEQPTSGRTTTLANGTFAMALNGGLPVTLGYAKDGHLGAQRVVTPEWLTFVSAPELALVAKDPVVTTVQPGATTVQAAQNTPVTDDSGTRQTSLLFEPGTTATAVLPDGTEQQLTGGLSVRATEFTVGSNGQEAMPGELPFNSGYTWAAEFSVDQADAAGAASVEFSKPVNSYVDNFLNFRAGTTVPAGYFDRQQGRWVAGPNGVVIDVLGKSDAATPLALLDSDGDGVADSAARYAALSIDDAERAKLAELYPDASATAVRSLWRVPVDHFTPWDYNYPYGPPDDATPPPDWPPHLHYPSGDPKDEPCNIGGSIIGCEAQTLGETIAVPGSEHVLRYESDLVPGRSTERSLTVPLTGSSIPGSLRDVRLVVEVAGRTFEQHFSPTANLKHTFTWDGKDSAGNLVIGTVKAKFRIGYGYVFVYKTPSQFTNSFARFGTSTLFTRSGSTPVSQPNVSYVEKEMVHRFSVQDARGQGLGGWMLDSHGVYDRVSKSIVFGDGRRWSAASARSVQATLFGGYEWGYQGFCGDGGPATQACFSTVRGAAFDAVGNLYVADTGNSRVRRIDSAGIVTTVAGGGSPEDGIGDGGAATAARLVSPWDVSVLPDGSLVVSDLGANTVRKVAADGTISTLAGGGTPADGVGDGLDANDAALSRPRGIAVGPDGVLYIADSGHKTVRAVNPDGSIATIAGGGAPVDGVGDGGPATSAALELPADVAVLGKRVLISDGFAHRVREIGVDGVITTFAGNGEAEAPSDGAPAVSSSLARPAGLAVTAEGSVLIADRLHQRIRRVDPDGVIVTAVGNGVDGAQGLGEHPTNAQLSAPESVAVGPDGRVVVGDTLNYRLLQVTASITGSADADVAVPSADGSEVYEFTLNGRHLRTVNSVTGIARRTFGYDAAGRLASVTDVNGRKTTVERGSTGRPTAVVAPGGARLALTTTDDGYLASATGPDGAKVLLTYGSGGLLTSLTDPRAGVHSYQYDAVGRLVKDTGPSGKSSTLSREEIPGGFRVRVADALGAERTYTVERLPGGVQRRTVTGKDGSTAVELRELDGTTTTTAPTGERVLTTVGPDPRFGLLAPLTKEVQVTADGSTSTTTFEREVTGLSPTNVLDFTTLVDRVREQSGTSTSVFTKASRTYVMTTPQGREQVRVLDERGREKSVASSGAPTTSFVYDAAGNLVSEATQSGTAQSMSSFTYDAHGQLLTSTDPTGIRTDHVRDAVGREVAQRLPDGSTTAFTYDATGNTTSVTPPGRSPHAFTFDAVGNMTSYTPPAAGTSGTTSWAYDTDGKLTSLDRPAGTTVAYTRDSAGRMLTARATATPASTGLDRDFTYAPGSDLFVGARDGAQALTYAHDRAGQTRQASWNGPVNGSVTAERDARRLLSGLQVGSQPATTFAYDADGLLTRAGDLSVARSTSGAPTSLVVGQVSEAREYDALGRLSRTGATGAGSSLLDVSRTVDAAGRVTSRTESTPGGPVALGYRYDIAGRLTEVTRGGAVVEKYTYDSNGNRLSAVSGSTVENGVYDAADRVTSYGDRTYVHNQNGERTSETRGSGTQSYRWNAVGGLASATLPDGAVVDYVLDGQGRRVGRKVGGALERGYLYWGDRVVAETDASGAVTTTYSYATNREAPELMVRGGTTYRLVLDDLANVRRVVHTGTGEVVQALDYDAFGRVLRDTNPGFQPFGFAGGLTDAGTGLVHFGARDYDPFTGRWLSVDPLLFSGGDTNLYSYVGNNPVNFTDPTGRGWRDVLHDVADVASFAPSPIGSIVSAADTLLYLSEGKHAEAAQAAIGIIPGGKYLTKIAKYDNWLDNNARGFKKWGDQYRERVAAGNGNPNHYLYIRKLQDQAGNRRNTAQRIQDWAERYDKGASVCQLIGKRVGLTFL